MSQDPVRPRPASGRTTVRRGAKRAVYDRESMLEMLRIGVVAHLGVATGEGPLVLPMVYGIDDATMYLHGALANSLLSSADGTDVCATVTILDGLVVSKTPFNHSVNYRSVVVRGRARVVIDEAEILHALRLMTDHIVPTWNVTRPPTANEIRATRVIAIPLDEMSAKVRSGGAINVPEDEESPYWSGHLPMSTSFGSPVTDADSGSGVPPAVDVVAGRAVDRRWESGT